MPAGGRFDYRHCRNVRRQVAVCRARIPDRHGPVRAGGGCVRLGGLQEVAEAGVRSPGPLRRNAAGRAGADGARDTLRPRRLRVACYLDRRLHPDGAPHRPPRPHGRRGDFLQTELPRGRPSPCRGDRRAVLEDRRRDGPEPGAGPDRRQGGRGRRAGRAPLLECQHRLR